MLAEGYYPVMIRESRYGGVYSHGDFVIMAGKGYAQNTGAFGGDSTCMEFWEDVREHGPIVTVDDNPEPTDVYVAAGDDPTTLYEEMLEFLRGSE